MADSHIVYQVLLSLHLIGLALGLGAAAVSDISFFKSMRMGDRITPETVNWMRSFSQVVWMGIGLLTLSGIGLFLLKPEEYLHSSGFLAKMLFVLILIVNGFFLNFYTTARLTTFNFSEKYQHRGAAWRARKLSFLFGAISAVTWYATLIIAMMKSLLNLTFGDYVLIYLIVLVFAVAGSLIMEHLLYLHFRPKAVPIDPDKQPISTLAASRPPMPIAQAQNSNSPPPTTAL